MASLWSSSDASAWRAAWARYDAALASTQKDELDELDAWHRRELPRLLREREPDASLSRAELERLMTWKLKKGKWRPQLMKFVQALDDEQVKSASAAAFKAWRSDDFKAAFDALCELKGVGPATASAILTAYDPNIPFMGDEALEAVAKIIGPRKYTFPHYKLFVEQMKKKAAWLQKELGNDDDEKDGETSWTPQRVQLCLYAATHDQQSSKPTKKAEHEKPKKAKSSPAPKRKSAENPSKSEEKEDDKAGADEQAPRRSQRKRSRAT